MTVIKKWFIATRPWSYTAASVPVLAGSAFAWWQFETLHVGLFFLTLVGAILFQTATNLLNTYGDYKKGVDTVESAVTCPQLVTGQITSKQMYIAGMITLGITILIGFYLIYATGPWILLFGFIGVLGTYGYTTGPRPYKYLGLGSILVFFLMGPLMTAPSYYIQTLQLNAGAFWISAPICFWVSAILHGNDLRDIAHDENAKIQTLAIWLQKDCGIRHYVGLCIGAVLSTILLVVFQIVPLTALLPLILLPKIWKICRKLVQETDSIIVPLEGITAKLHFEYGLLWSVGIALGLFFK